MDEPSLRNTLAALRRRRRVIVLSVVLVTGAALAFSLLQPVRYRARAQLLLKQSTGEEIMVDEIGQARTPLDSARELNNEIRMIESQPVREAVGDVYNGPLDVRDVTAVAPDSANNDLIELQLKSRDRKAATDLVNLYAQTYIEERRDRQVDDLLAAGEKIQTRLDTVNQRIAEVSKPLDDINAQVSDAPANSDRRAQLEDERNRVLSQVLPQLSPLLSRSSSFQGQLQQLDVSEDLARAGGLAIINPAEEPHTPVSPRTVRNVVAGALVGLFGGIALALLLDHLDDSVSAKEEIQAITGLPTLGLVPKLVDRPRALDLPSVRDPSSPAAEAYRLLRTSVKFLGLDSRLRTLVVTSPGASEGKTMTAANLAVVLAQGGDRVLLVGADLRRPRIHELFGAPQTPGLTTVMLSGATTESATYAVDEVPELHLLPPGPTPPNPAELLDSERAGEIVTTAAALYDVVVIDSPPVLPVTDAQVLARLADAVLLVVAFGETSRRGLARAIELLGQVAAPTVGTVVNLVPIREGYGGEPYRYETYRSRSERRRRRQQAAARDTAGAGAAAAAHLAGNGADPPEAQVPERVEQDAGGDQPR